ncbi:MAG: bifunctional adenosylcobinamide kinase/adenosylcobinamide-phosphate guanylyltransferase [Rhodobacterales bacterium]|nr:MAG: bifunctional adenosylcobinamide kinase/adenosylcobinamide-phosphate guanylyltransferase [Rhodobacterales bacterium]
MERDLPHLTLVIGAAASGKSAFAERLLIRSGRRLVYIATAEGRDDEMQVKIVAHRARRGSGWTTIEAPLDLVTPLAEAQPHEAVLIDCATLWLSNQMASGTDLTNAESGFLYGVSACRAPVCVVTNEVGAGVVPDNALARRFRSAQGRLNQGLAARADLAVQVVAGLPLVLKGTLPEWAT